MRSILIVLAAAAGLCARQPNTVTASVSKTQAIAAGTALFSVQLVEATLASNVDSALAALGPVGVSASQLNGVSVEISQGFIVSTYNFRIPVPAAGFTATRDKLITVQRNLANSQTQAIGWSSVQTPTNEDLAAALQQAMPSLLEKARQRADILAQHECGARGVGPTLRPRHCPRWAHGHRFAHRYVCCDPRPVVAQNTLRRRAISGCLKWP